MTTYLALGTNLGDKRLNLLKALALIAERIGNLSAISSVYETEAWGFESKNSFLNMVVAVNTILSPNELLQTTQQIEKEIGRKSKSQNQAYEDRLIDIDIILYENLTHKTGELEIPHPLFRQRTFVLDPLKEIATPEVQECYNI